MNTNLIQKFAFEVQLAMDKTQIGHCARVDYLPLADAHEICQYLVHNYKSFKTSILAANNLDFEYNIRVDEAIEIRNLKNERFCLIVPSNLNDAACSSLANSFAVIDSRKIYNTILKQIRSQLPSQALYAIKLVSQHKYQQPIEKRLEYAFAIEEGKSPGMELWRIGLIPDNNNYIDDKKLERNRDSVIIFSRPAKVSSSTIERVRSVNVDKETAQKLIRFFQTRSTNDAATWVKDILEHPDLFFDQWKFSDVYQSDIESVELKSFLKDGFVDKTCKLIQDNPTEKYSALKAKCGPKEKLIITWKTEPEKTTNIHSWKIRIVPANWSPGNDDVPEDFREPSIPNTNGDKRKATIKLNFDEDEIPEGAVRVYLAPVDAINNEILDKENNVIYALSDEFYFDTSSDEETDTETPTRIKVRPVPTWDFGYLRLQIENKFTEDEEPNQTKSEENGLIIYTRQFNNRQKLTLTISHFLSEVEKLALKNHENLGIFNLSVNTVHILNSKDVKTYPNQPSTLWTDFLKKREELFSEIVKQNDNSQNIECLNWTSRLVKKALDYSKEYLELLELLIEEKNTQQLCIALSVDSLYINVTSQSNHKEEILITLPTHPMRIAWYMGYTQLLQNWRKDLAGIPSVKKRKSVLNEYWVKLIEPTNVPFMSWNVHSNETFVFFKNFLFFSGVSTPIKVTDPNRLFGDIAMMFGIDYIEDLQSDTLITRLANHFRRFNELHPYLSTQLVTLINPDRGVEIAEALQKALEINQTDEDEDESDENSTTKYALTAFVEDKHLTNLPELTKLQEKIAKKQKMVSAYFNPNLSVTVRKLSLLKDESMPNTHLLIMMDYAEGRIYPRKIQDIHSESYVALNGLIIRLEPFFESTDSGLTWTYALYIPENQKLESIQNLAKYGEVLIGLYQTYMKAGGMYLRNNSDYIPTLTIQLSPERMQLLEQFHRASNWVITMDRFITMDFYDSPYLPNLSMLSRKYIVDYSPEVVETIGHRIMVTTSWHSELEDLLGRVIADLGLDLFENGVGSLLQTLKMLSGRLALSVLEPNFNALQIIGMGIVTLLLQKNGDLQKGILIPVNINQDLFWSESDKQNQEHCDLVLISAIKNQIEFCFIEVKWRHNLIAIETLKQQMRHRMEVSEKDFFEIYQNESRLDAPLRRAYLTNVIRFYLHRAKRYHLLNQNTLESFNNILAMMEKKIPPAIIRKRGFIVVPGYSSEYSSKTSQSDQTNIEIISTDILVDLPIPPETIEVTDYPIEYQTPLKDNNSNQSLQIPTLDTTINQEKQAVEPKILLGYSKNNLLYWSPKVTGNPHLFIVGTPGQGKSYALINILKELDKAHIPSLVMDFHGQFADPTGIFVSTVHPTILDAANGLPFSPFECQINNSQFDWNLTSYNLAEIIASVAELGDMQKDIVYKAIKKSYQNHDFNSINEIESEELELPTLEEVQKIISTLERKEHVSNVSARCRPLFELNVFKPTEQPSNLIKSIQSGLVIDLHNVRIEKAQIAAGAFILNKIYRDMFGWGPAAHPRLAIVLDEAHRLTKDVSLPKIMKEGRKFGISVLVASQSARDFHQDILPNVGTKICFRVNYPESKQIASYLGQHNQNQIIEQIQKLTQGQAFIQTPEMPSAQLTEMVKLEK